MAKLSTLKHLPERDFGAHFSSEFRSINEKPLPDPVFQQPARRSVSMKGWKLCMLPVARQVPVEGLYSSAVLPVDPTVLLPAATSTCPLRSRVAPCKVRGIVMLP